MSGSTYIAGINAAGTQYYVPYEDQEWDVAGGFHAPVQGWVVPKEICDAIMTALASLSGAAREVTLTLGDPNAPITIQRVIVIGTAPADNVQKRMLLLTDVRWYFTRAWMVMDVNVRRRLGDTRLIGNVLTGTSIADKIAYAAWSLNDASAYDWASLRDQTLAYLTAARHGRPAITHTVDTFHVLDVSAKIVQETVTDAHGNLGLARAIESTPGAGIYVDLAGVVHVYETTAGAENAVIAALPPALDSHGDIILADRSQMRPAASAHSWRVYVDWEVEVRFTYNFSGTGLWNDLGANDPFLVPVLKVTDQSLFIPGGTYTGIGTVAARFVGQGSWITFEEAFAAWGATTYGSITLPALTDDIVARHWFSDQLHAYTVGELIGSYDPVWGDRVDEVIRCYRTRFRVNPALWDRIRRAWAIRAAIWDPATGQRGPAPVYQNFNLVPVGPWASSQIPDMSVNVTDSYDNATGLLVNGRPTGFHVKVEDDELGVLAIDRNALSKYPGNEKINISPVQQIPKLSGDVVDGELANQQLIVATSGTDAWKLALILSCSPAAPNDLRRMFEVQVSLADAAASVGLSSVPSVNTGPDMEMRSHLSQARVAWQDDSGVFDEILALLGTGDAHPAITTDDPIATLVPINLTQELQPLAKVIAGTYLLQHLDRHEGSRAVPMDGNLCPLGSITRVVHRVKDNRAVSVVHCEGHAPPFRAVDFLTGAARSFLLKEIASVR